MRARDLLRGRIHLVSGTLDGVTARIVRTGPREFNVSDLLVPRAERGGPTLTTTIDGFTVRNVTATIEDRTVTPALTRRVSVEGDVRGVSTLAEHAAGMASLRAMVDTAPLSLELTDVRLAPVRLRGTFNLPLNPGGRERLLRERSRPLPFFRRRSRRRRFRGRAGEEPGRRPLNRCGKGCRRRPPEEEARVDQKPSDVKRPPLRWWQGLDRYCWVKGDPSFETLRMACLSPDTRGHIGPRQPMESDTHGRIARVSAGPQPPRRLDRTSPDRGFRARLRGDRVSHSRTRLDRVRAALTLGVST